MMKGAVTLGFLLLALTGCRGQAGELPEEVITYSFDAKVAVNPTMLQTNKRVSFNLEVTSASNRTVKTDIVLKVVSKDGETAYESIWNDVLFHENEVWNLTQGFLPASDAARKPWSVTILVRNQETQEVLFNQSIATLAFNQ
ncbi:MAG: hypothetical protein H6Q89_966 [Myxococcaceae bacterium]|nr:hypothetical protein [Myxococcaceae bacterium]